MQEEWKLRVVGGGGGLLQVIFYPVLTYPTHTPTPHVNIKGLVAKSKTSRS